MRVRLLTLLAGPGGIDHPGSVVEVSEATARAWIERGYAVALDPPVRLAPPIEVALAPEAPEQAVSDRGRRRRGL